MNHTPPQPIPNDIADELIQAAGITNFLTVVVTDINNKRAEILSRENLNVDRNPPPSVPASNIKSITSITVAEVELPESDGSQVMRSCQYINMNSRE